jgi:hypothetical protein
VAEAAMELRLEVRITFLRYALIKSVVPPCLSGKNQHINSSSTLRYIQVQVYKTVLADLSNALSSNSLHTLFGS